VIATLRARVVNQNARLGSSTTDHHVQRDDEDDEIVHAELVYHGKPRIALAPADHTMQGSVDRSLWIAATAAAPVISAMSQSTTTASKGALPRAS
jgi:hypothetical protein